MTRNEDTGEAAGRPERRPIADAERPADPALSAPIEADLGGGPGAPGAGAPGAGVNEAVVAAFESELAEARQSADENWDRYLRAEAELDNLRKRAERQREESVKGVRRELLSRMLEVADNLERALAHGDADPRVLLEGVETTYRELGRLLAREGVEQIAAAEAPFDPELHEAVGVVTLPGLEEERVVSVEQPGYTLKGELLRPARVIVGRGD